MPKILSSREVIVQLIEDGWYHVHTVGSHSQFIWPGIRTIALLKF